MTETTKTIFEKYQVRKTKKQKSKFIEYIEGIAENKGYSFKVEKGFGARNILVGDIEKASVVYTAHYDTCVKLPFPNFITPKNFWCNLVYQLVSTLPMLIITVLIGLFFGIAATITAELLGITISSYILISSAIYVALFIMLGLMLAGPANKNTANDNTSGVTTLIDIMNNLPAEDKARVAFVFFDLEESGLIGSTAFALKHSRVMKQKLLLNFDCVSDGENIIFAVRKKAKKYAHILEQSFVGNDRINVQILTKGIFYPSDQMNFPLGVAVAALKKTKKLKILYMDRIHTKRDIIYSEENIEFLKQGSIKLAKNIRTS